MAAAGAALRSALATALLVAGLVAAIYVAEELLLLLPSGDERRPSERHPAASWLLIEYPRRFVDFYAPKLRAAWALAGQGARLALEDEGFLAAVDYTAALVAVTSVFHLIERLRLVAIERLKTAECEDSSAVSTPSHDVDNDAPNPSDFSVAEIPRHGR